MKGPHELKVTRWRKIAYGEGRGKWLVWNASKIRFDGTGPTLYLNQSEFSVEPLARGEMARRVVIERKKRRVR